MVLGEALRTTLTEVWAHKLRSALTLVGVILGTLAVVTMISLIEAVKVAVFGGISDLGFSEVMFVSAAAPRTPADARRAHLSAGLTPEDGAAITADSELIRVAAPIAFSRLLIAWGEESRSIEVRATTPAYREVFERRVAAGRYLVDFDQLRRRRVVVVGKQLAEDLFVGRDAVGEWVRLGGHRFEVVGVGTQIGNAMVGQEGWSLQEMEGAVIPLSTFRALYADDRRVPLLAVKVAGTDRLSAIQALLRNRMWRQHRRVEDFQVDNVAAEIVEAEARIDEELRGWTVVLFAISAISLVVGGVGIFSVMQISLAERLYEIGLRKSIGARDGDILTQFLTEAVFLSILGGAIGLGLAAVVCAAVGPQFPAGLPIARFGVVLALVFAVGVGLVAGIYPSLRAARMTPVEALRG